MQVGVPGARSDKACSCRMSSTVSLSITALTYWLVMCKLETMLSFIIIITAPLASAPIASSFYCCTPSLRTRKTSSAAVQCRGDFPAHWNTIASQPQDG